MERYKIHPAFKYLENQEEKTLFASLVTPCYIIDEVVLEENLKILNKVMKDTGCKILLAQKAFSNYDFYPLISKYLSGTEASGLFEARLGKEEMPNKEVHVFCGAYKEKDFIELLDYADHIVFNSIYQLKKFGPLAKARNKSIGLRINPEYSTQVGHEIYDPCSLKSRLGVTKEVFDLEMDQETLKLLDGLHFHTLCEQNSDDLESTLDVFIDKFKDVLPYLTWLNMGGGHHITRNDYDIDTLVRCIKKVQDNFHLEVYLEPGEAIALNAGYLVTRVLDLVKNGPNNIALVDASAACHMPDVIEMPYRPPLFKSGEENELKYNYLLGGPTCLSGDVIGAYSFNKKLERDDLFVFGDMAIYTTCKNNTFNGMPLPNIYSWNHKEFVKLTNFGYLDFKKRLGK